MCTFIFYLPHREEVGALHRVVAPASPSVVTRHRAVAKHHQVREPAPLSVRKLQREVDPRPRIRYFHVHLPLAYGVRAVNHLRRPLLLVRVKQ